MDISFGGGTGRDTPPPGQASMEDGRVFDHFLDLDGGRVPARGVQKNKIEELF